MDELIILVDKLHSEEADKKNNNFCPCFIQKKNPVIVEMWLPKFKLKKSSF